jgi:hypothetical protein
LIKAKQVKTGVNVLADMKTAKNVPMLLIKLSPLRGMPFVKSEGIQMIITRWTLQKLTETSIELALM